MEEQLISFETAKLAKEKGFDEKCMYYWSIHHAGIKREELNSSFSRFLQNFNGDLFIHETWSAPTQSLLQKWLREIHGIQVYSWYDRDAGWQCLYEEIRVDVYDKFFHFNTYEEALEKGLIEALKLINQ